LNACGGPEGAAAASAIFGAALALAEGVGVGEGLGVAPASLGTASGAAEGAALAASVGAAAASLGWSDGWLLPPQAATAKASETARAIREIIVRASFNWVGAYYRGGRDAQEAISGARKPAAPPSCRCPGSAAN
jgi:hypothetical protein